MAWQRWSGGRLWIAKDGTRTYYGEVGGRMVSTRRNTEEEAFAEILRMNLQAGTARLLPLDQKHVNQYVDDCRSRGIDPQSCNQKRRHLEDWGRAIGPRWPTLQLLNGISAKLKGKGARGRVSTLKAFFTWLRQQGHVRRQEDPTLDLAKPSAKPSDWDRLVPIEVHRRLVADLDPKWGDLLVVLLGTGWHVSELLRFARSGSISADVLACPRHKSGEPHRTRVSPNVMVAAGRVLGRGGFSVSLFYKELGEACDRLGVERIGPGGYRHTVATAAVRAGATPEAVAHFLGHKGSYMVKAIYAKVAVPQRVPTLE